MPEQEMIGDCPSTAASDGAAETPYTSVKVLAGRTIDEQMLRVSRVTDAPRRVQCTREASQEDALVSARHFFAPENGLEQVVQTRFLDEIPTTTGGATIETPTIITTSAVLTTSTITTTANVGTGSSSPFLPNGTPSRPAATATCRQWTWVKRISEGWTGMPPPDDTKLGESNLHVPPSSVEEEIPENLGEEWRVLHHFKLPGVGHPTVM